MILARVRLVGSRTAANPGNRLPYYLALAAVVFAVFSRLVVSWGLPSPLNFVHIPLALAAFATTRHPSTTHHRRTVSAITAFSLFAAFSGVMNGVEPARVLSATILWVEPVLIAYVIWVALDESDNPRLPGRAGRNVLILAIAAQFALMTVQIPRQLSLPGWDWMQGTFPGSGTGAHVAPAVALIGVVLLLDSAFISLRARWVMLIAAIYGLFLAQLAQARAVTLVFMAALFFGVLIVGHPRFGKRWIAAGLSGLIAVGVWITLPLLANVPDFDRQRPGWEVKLYGVELIVGDMKQDVAFAIIGQGPGMTLSRVAIQTPDANLNPTSPIASLGFKTSDFTREVVAVRSKVAIAASSVFSPDSTLIGILGDVGAVGLALYISMWLPLAAAAIRTSRSRQSTGTLVIVIATALLGLLQIWLEEPGYILPVALLLALIAGNGWSSTVTDP